MCLPVNVIVDIVSRLTINEMFRCARVCKQWHHILKMGRFAIYYETINGRPFNWLHYVICKYQNLNWNADILATNPNTGVDFLQERGYTLESTAFCFQKIPRKLINAQTVTYYGMEMSMNKDFDLTIVDEYPSRHWFYLWMSENRNLTREFVESHPSFEWNWNTMIFLTMKDVLRMPHITWDWRTLSKRIDFKDIVKNLNHPWVWENVSANPTLNLTYVFAHLDLDWNWPAICFNYVVTIKDLLDHPNFDKWVWSSLSIIIPYKDIVANPELPWNWKSICFNSTLTIKDILTPAEASFPWDWEALSVNSAFSVCDIWRTRHLPWAFSSITRRTNLC
jgi:hypothetical protein